MRRIHLAAGERRSSPVETKILSAFIDVHRRLKIVHLAALLLLFILAGAAADADRKTQPDRLAYMTFQSSNWDIYLFSQPGKAPKRLTDYAGLDYDPAVSPDGRWLVFTSERRGNPDLYALDLQRGGPPHLLIDSERMEDQAAFSPDGKFLFFVSTYSGNADIYRLPFRPGKTVSMKEAENLTHSPSAELRPSISPDGRMMAFSSDRDLPIFAPISISRLRSGDIWTLNLSDGVLHRLTHVSGTGWNGSPKWSADGKQIVYYSWQLPSRQDTPPASQPSPIMVMDADGSNQRAVTSRETAALSPEFLPDGRILYARRNKQDREEIVTVNPDGSGERIESGESENSYWGPVRGPSKGSFVAYGTGPVAAEPPGEYHRTFLSNGPALVAGAPFRRKLPDREVELYPIRYFVAILNPRADLIIHTEPSAGSKPVELYSSRIDGSQQRKILTLEPAPAQRIFSAMNWSKDGQWVLFTRGHTDVPLRIDKMEADVWRVRPDGSAAQNLTPDSAGFDGYPSFSGDGKQVVFVSSRDGSLDLYLMNSDGTNVRRLTNDHAIDLFPTYSPTANQIAFVSNRDNPKSQIFDVYLLDLDANGAPGRIRRITHDEGQHGHTQYSYDGKWIVFASEAGGISDEYPIAPAPQLYGELFAYRISDGTMIRLTDNKWEEGMASWEAPLAGK
jgi:Tol biopolymer transport system component